jgi:hypothetical protein
MSNNGYDAPMHRYNRAAFLLHQIESEPTRTITLRHIVIHLINPFFGVFPGPRSRWTGCHVSCAPIHGAHEI